MIHSTAARNAIAEAIRTLIDAGSAGGKIKARTGSTPGAGTLLATHTFDTVSTGSPSTGVITGASFPKEVNGVADGTIGNVEITDSDDNIVLQTADVGTGANQASYSSLTVVNGAPCRINSWTYAVPAGT